MRSARSSRRWLFSARTPSTGNGWRKSSRKAPPQAKRAGEALESDIAEFRGAVVAVLNESAAALSTMQEAARELSAAAAETEAGASKATSASQEVSTNVAGVAAATRELSAGTGSMATSVSRAESAIDQAANRASVASATIDSLSEVAQTIEDVTQFIDTIAQQTNLLALNATIEAARAGESGRGFAVVAAEVKTLATQTAKATTDIAQRIEEMRRRTTGVVEAIRVITETTGEANAHAASITGAVTQQNHVTATISKSIQDAAGWTAGLSRVVDDLAAAVARTGGGAEGGIRLAGRPARRRASSTSWWMPSCGKGGGIGRSQLRRSSPFVYVPSRSEPSGIGAAHSAHAHVIGNPFQTGTGHRCNALAPRFRGDERPSLAWPWRGRSPASSSFKRRRNSAISALRTRGCRSPLNASERELPG